MIFPKPRPFDQEEFPRRRPAKLFDVQLFVASAEDVIISKLEWAKLGGSQRQIEDAAKVLVAQGKALDKNYLSQWIATLQLQQQWEGATRLAEYFGGSS